MKLLTEEEVKAWCEPKGLTVTADKYLGYRNAPLHCFTVKLDGRPLQQHALAGNLLSPWEDESFGGALVWVRERGIGTERAENTAEWIMQLMHGGLGSSEDIDKLPGALFGPQELWEMLAFFSVPLLFGWDAFVVLESPNCFVFTSHDEVFELVAPSRGTYETKFERCVNWKPQLDLSYYPRIVSS